MGTPFFKSLAKKPYVSMDDLFRWADKYVMLEDDVRAASQQLLVMNKVSKNTKTRNLKPSNGQSKQGNQRQKGQRQQ